MGRGGGRGNTSVRSETAIAYINILIRYVCVFSQMKIVYVYMYVYIKIKKFRVVMQE